MSDEGTPKQLGERTGRHYCITCLAEVSAEVFLRNDHICDACAEKDEYPFASTPNEREEKKPQGR